ncbi:hypothetical protein EXU48_23970 [Occultella glacieicola]|uniref:Uncharacterized protein n=1 Tax=Occultella glacieicola TaxID=2518684 RepID=A0ABY2DWL9_9MICO|nr:hypothetical protein [Occultella glacieicola]TDE88181.1 hypothetical protein EXU48_23970 [Occultella glacieicola]
MPRVTALTVATPVEGSTVNTPRISLGEYIGYITTPDSRLRNRARMLRDVSPYDPAKEYWRHVRLGVEKDRRTTRDGQAVYAAALSARRGREENFRHVAEVWERIVRRWRRHQRVVVDPVTINIGGADVVVRPRFAERDPSGQREIVFVRFSVTAPLDVEKANKILRIAQRAYPRDTVVIVDLPCGEKAYVAGPARNLSRYDEALERDGLHIASILAVDDVA